MINVSELRIGNIVSNNDYSNELFTVASINFLSENGEDYYAIKTNGGKNEVWSNPLYLIDPVPLSIDIIRQFGFEEDGWIEQRCNNVRSRAIIFYNRQTNYYLHFIEDENKLKATFLLEGYTKIELYIYYAHQLQNIYFDLTGKELIINS